MQERNELLYGGACLLIVSAVYIGILLIALYAVRVNSCQPHAPTAVEQPALDEFWRSMTGGNIG